MNRPLVSVVMVVFNVDAFLAESIESILGQTFKDFEFIIVDFGSTDKTKTIVSSYAAKDGRITLHEVPNCGLAAARNAGGLLAQGRYIAIMDADDVSLPNRLKWQVDFLEKHPEVSLVGGATEWIDANGRSLGIHRFPTEDHKINSTLVIEFPLCHPTVLIRTRTFVLIGGYREAFVFGEDYDLWLRIVEQFRCANLSQVVLKYRNHPCQVQSSRARQQTLCLLAAQASASLRRNGKPDLFNSIKEITPAVLAALGVTEAKQRVTADRDWIRAMDEAGRYSTALNAATEALHSADWEYAERWEIASMRLTVARLYWKERRFARSFLTVGHAFIARPAMLVRPLKPFLRWFRFRWATTLGQRTPFSTRSMSTDLPDVGGPSKSGERWLERAELQTVASPREEMRCPKTN